MTGFIDKTAWITGASSGIGRALAIELAGRGARLILSGRNEAALAEVASSVGVDTLVLPFEATDAAATTAAARSAVEWQAGVDLLVNNAGISQRSLPLDTAFDVYRTLMKVDFFAPFRLTQLILPHMVERGSGQIAIVASVAGKVGVPLRSGYSAAKHACIGYFDTLRADIELAHGIDVSVILPGSVRTDVARNALSADGSRRDASDHNIADGMPPEHAARLIVDGLEAKSREIIVAEGLEAQALQLRAHQPDTLFDLVASEGKRLADARARDGQEWRPEPTKVRPG